MEGNSADIEDDSILYELLEYFVKKQEPELIKWRNDTAILPTPGTIKTALRYLNNRYSLPESISQQVSLSLPWKFSIDSNGRLLALLLDTSLEIRKSKDEFSSVMAKATVPKDAFPHWRKLAWSPDASLLVLASSNGSLSFYNSLGNNIFSITPRTISQNPEILEAGDAIASLMFKPLKDEADKWSYEFLIITYSGLLKSYSISASQGYRHNYEFSFGSFYRKGVNAFAYSPKHNLYIVAGNSITQSHLASPASTHGLTSWRPLNDYPFYKLSFNFEENFPSTLSLWNLIPTFRTPPAPVIFRISISPSCRHLVALHTDGAVSLWDLPNLQLRRRWSLTEQPGFNLTSPSLQSPDRRKAKTPQKQNSKINESQTKKASSLSEIPVDIGWWSDHSIIIARYSGSISVCSISSLRNLLGASPEFLSGQPQISEFYSGKGFLALDCETVVSSKKRKRPPSHDGSTSDQEESDEEDELEPITLADYTINLIKGLMYSITDIERFQPKRKKSKILLRTYRVMGLRSTTPEELYARKIDVEEYKDALSLANTYNLDKDLVYQTQWRKSGFTLEAIDNHLGKVSKRDWVLNECISRVPGNLDAARKLLSFGLKETSLIKLVKGSEKEGEDLDDSTDLRHAQKVNDVLRNLGDLTNQQKDLINYRRKILDHLDKLKTYEIIHDATNVEKGSYDEFRSLTILDNAIKFAKNSNYKAVEILFTYHGSKLLPHWLPIISCFPETLSPLEYQGLLPECDEEGQVYLLYQKELRPGDWSERSQFEDILQVNQDTLSSEKIYEDEPSLLPFKMPLSMNLLTKWYKFRANQIERDSCIVENALDLIKVGKSRKIQELEGLLVELETLSNVIYNVSLEEMSLAQLEKLSELEKVQLLMSKTSEKTFIDDILKYFLPFLERRRDYLGRDLEKGLFRDYLVAASENDLTLPSVLFSNLGQEPRILEAIEDVLSLALECVYSCLNFEMLETAREIFEAVSRVFSGGRDRAGIENPLDDLEKELEGLKILKKYGVNSTARYLRDNKDRLDSAKVLLTEMARSLKDRSPPASQEAWTELLNDILEIQGLIFPCVDPETCFEIVVAMKLSSGIRANILECAGLVETRRGEGSLLKVSYEKAVELIAQASREYFDDSKSLRDPTIELAKSCLGLVKGQDDIVQREFDLINALQVLDEFNVNILPLQVRTCQNKLKLVESCLNSYDGAHRRQQRLLTLATYLHIDDRNPKRREGQVLQLIAAKSLQIKDYASCASTCEQLISNCYPPAWSVTRDLGLDENFEDLEFKKNCLWFSITHGPSEILEESLKQVHLLEIQLLNKSLQTFLSSSEIEADSEDEFIDAVTTPQSETREFPKIAEPKDRQLRSLLETSTGLVKNSTQIFTQSLGILKSALSGRNDLWEDPYDVEEDVTLERYRGHLQSFPFFYRSIHENCLVSRVDPRYTTYSTQVLDNTKLKICQTLIRVALLSETASYGLETSDIRHFIADCAAHVINDDWLLGFSYLLICEDVESVFKDMEKTDLHVQTILLYSIVKSWKKRFPNHLPFFSYDPTQILATLTQEDIKNNEALKKCQSFWGKSEEEGAEDEGGKFEISAGIGRKFENESTESAKKIEAKSTESRESTEDIQEEISEERSNDLAGKDEKFENCESSEEVGGSLESGRRKVLTEKLENFGKIEGGGWGDDDLDEEEILLDDDVEKNGEIGESTILETHEFGLVDGGDGWGDEGWGEDWTDDGEPEIGEKNRILDQENIESPNEKEENIADLKPEKLPENPQSQIENEEIKNCEKKKESEIKSGERSLEKIETPRISIDQETNRLETTGEGWEDWPDEDLKIENENNEFSEENEDNICDTKTEKAEICEHFGDENLGKNEGWDWPDPKPENENKISEKSENPEISKNCDQKNSEKIGDGWDDWPEATDLDDEKIEPPPKTEISKNPSNVRTLGPQISPNFEPENSPKIGDEEESWDDWPEAPEQKCGEEKIEMSEDKIGEKIDAGWGGDWVEFPDAEGEETDPHCQGQLPKSPVASDRKISRISEEERFRLFEDLFGKMKSKSDCRKLKDLMERWPSFDKPEFLSVEKNPGVRMIERTFVVVFGGKGSTEALEEFRGILRTQSVPEEVLKEFLKKFDEKCGLEGKIILRLCSNIPQLQSEAIDLMKSSKLPEFSLPVLEEVFFRNLTSSFAPHHPIYDKILEQMFLNHDLPQLEPHMRLLIKRLKEEQHIPYAVSLWNQMKGVPPALATFESCFQLLMKE